MDPDRLNIRRISAETGVSTATISRVLNDKPDVSPATRKRILAYLQRIGYEPRVVSGSVPLVGFVDTFSRHTLSSYYLSTILDAFERKMRSCGYNTVLISSDSILGELQTHAHPNMLRLLDGVLWLEPVYSSRFAKALARHRVPCVVVNNCEAGVQVDVIESDNSLAAQQAVEFLLDKGHREIGFVGGWLHLTNHKDRFDAYKEKMKKSGIEILDDWIIDDITLWNEDGGAEGLHRLLSRKRRPSAVLLCSDYLAEGAYRAAREMGLTIPRDISIISFDDFPLAKYLDPPLTTFRQPLQEMAEIAATRLISLMAGEERTPERQHLRCPLIVRKSVETAANGRGAARGRSIA